MLRVWKIIQSSSISEETLADTQWYKDAQMFRVQQIIQSNSTSEEAPAHSQRRNVAKMCTMQTNHSIELEI